MPAESDSEKLKQATEHVAHCRNAGDQIALAEAVTKLAYLERQLKLTDDAARHYEEAAAIYRTQGRNLAVAHSIRHVADIHQHAGRTDLAEPRYSEALAIYGNDSATPPLDLANAIRGLAILKEGKGEKDAAKLLWREARNLYQSVNVQAGVAESERRLAGLG